MIQYPHTDYSWYVAVQKKLTARKTRGGETVLSWIDERGMCEVDVLLHLYGGKDIHKIVCHGCRSGLEVDILQKLNPSMEVWGTDIYGPAYKYDHTRFREMDFDTIPEEWIGYFDAVYSNSIDHSRDPISTLIAWRDELRIGGICFVNFHWGRGVSREDCFHLDPEKHHAEILEIAEKVKMDILYVSSPRSFADGAFAADVIMRKS
jgi:hypothetical protein